ncbi:hypothetical protein OC835_004259 [Tilletia horrida]|nr:hypothetical protein OC835_004259 [Tilletia horrida]
MQQGPPPPPPPPPLPQDLGAMLAQLAAHPHIMAMLQSAAAHPEGADGPAPDPSAPAPAPGPQDEDESSDEEEENASATAAVGNQGALPENFGLNKDPSTFTDADRERVRWTVDGAKAEAKTKRLQPSDVIVDFNGRPVTSALLKTIQGFVRKATAQLDDFSVADGLVNHTRNFLFWKTYYWPKLITIAEAIEKKHPVTSWAEDHYKSLKLFEVNLKNKVATGRKYGLVPPSSKKRGASAAATNTSSKRMKVSKHALQEHDDVGDEFDDADDDDDDDVSSRRSVSSSAARSLVARSSAANSSATRPTTAASSSAAASSASRSAAASSSQPQPASSALTQLRLANMDDLAPASPEGIFKALRIRYSSLPKAQELMVSKSIDQLKTARSCGLDARQSGEQAFESWLINLETVALPQDEVGQMRAADRDFGKAELESWGYEDVLHEHAAWGSVENACRLLAALLRLWLLAQDGQSLGRKGTEPAAHSHLIKVCGLVQAAFDPMGPDERAEDSSAGQKADQYSASGSSSPEKSRRRVKKALDKGIVTEDVLRSLPKYATVALLQKGAIEVPAGSKAADTTAMLLTAVKKGAIYIDADHVRQAQNKKPIEGDLTKGKKRMLLEP